MDVFIGCVVMRCLFLCWRAFVHSYVCICVCVDGWVVCVRGGDTIGVHTHTGNMTIEKFKLCNILISGHISKMLGKLMIKFLYGYL